MTLFLCGKSHTHQFIALKLNLSHCVWAIEMSILQWLLPPISLAIITCIFFYNFISHFDVHLLYQLEVGTVPFFFHLGACHIAGVHQIENRIG